MTIRTHTIKKKNPKHGSTWEWEETPELIAAIEQLEKSSNAVKAISVPKGIFIPNKNYAPSKGKRNE